VIYIFFNINYYKFELTKIIMNNRIKENGFGKYFNSYTVLGAIFLGCVFFLGRESGREERIRQEVIDFYDKNNNKKIDKENMEFFRAKKDLSDYTQNTYKLKYTSLNNFTKRDWFYLHEYVNLCKHNN
jgi:hypothetical protein